MSISQMLCEVRDKDYGRKLHAMARAWDVYDSTLSRWCAKTRVPDPTWYDFLAGKLGLSIAEVHEACQIERRERELATTV